MYCPIPEIQCENLHRRSKEKTFLVFPFPTLCHNVALAVSVYFAGFSHSGPCNNIFGCLEDEYFEQCMCSRDCGYDGDPVCGSDGQIYQNHCQMEVASCRNNTRIEQIPMSQCSNCRFHSVFYFCYSPVGEHYSSNQLITTGVWWGKENSKPPT